VGDLRGIISKLDYLERLGVDTVWLSPVYRSTNYDNGYDISDYLDIDPSFGTLADWEDLRDGLHARGMKLIMDLVVNHSSDAHPWFQQETRRKVLARVLAEARSRAAAAGEDAELRFVARVGAALRRESQPKGLTTAGCAEALAAIAAFRRDSAAPLPDGYPPAATQLDFLARTELGTRAQRAEALAHPIDFYIWREVPNNWTSVFGGPAWRRVDATGLHYLAEFTEHQPDFNWANPSLRAAIRGMVHTWIERGVDGFRMDVIDFIAKDPAFPDEPDAVVGANGTGMRYYADHPDVHPYLRELVAELRQRGLLTVGETPAITAEAAVRYTAPEHKELDQVFLFDHLDIDRPAGRWSVGKFELGALKRVLAAQQTTVHGRGWLANYLENHDQTRIVSRFGNDARYRAASAKMLATLLFTLEGTPYIYQGQELGMTNTRFRSRDDIDDIEALNFHDAAVAAGRSPEEVLAAISANSRDNTRTPMQWSAAPHAGFSARAPWLSVNGNYAEVNAADAVADSTSPFHTYRQLIALRRDNDVLLYGAFALLWPEHPNLLAYTRTLGDRTVWVLLNFSDRPQTLPEGDAALSGATRVLFDTEAASVTALLAPLRPYEGRVLADRGATS
jgi:oligo-1,6-glucosidase